MATGSTPQTPAQRILVRSLELLENGDARGWVDLFRPDGVLEFPYAPEGWPKRFEGRDALWAHMSKFPEHLSVTFSGIVFRETADPYLAIAEFHGNGTALSSGRPFVQEYISVLWSDDTEIVHYRDFWNPLLHLQALGGAEAAAQIVQS
ncbi:nuclear transport factor 2 family protein [Salinactinospora qingdaonensis]|uniref:Nuclear transport factor 2 family protein n=1 Tax=Salinactinospora qingdaonensis TaxID=702744 RepID=A0ABP7FF07_9ACTN